MSTTDVNSEAEVQRLRDENGHLRRALEYGNDTYVLAMAADRDAWKRRAERWKDAARAYRSIARAFWFIRYTTGYPTWRWHLRWFRHDSAVLPRRLGT